jgi:hypothetical protein
LFNEELKKFGLQLRYPAGEQARRAAPAIPWEQQRAEYWARNKTTPKRAGYLVDYYSIEQLERFLELANDPKLTSPEVYSARKGETVQEIFNGIFYII